MPSTTRERFATLALAIISPLVFLGLLELGAAAWGFPARSDSERYQARNRHRQCQWGVGDAASRCTIKNFRRGAHQLVVVLGGSSVFGYPLETQREAFPARLGRLLNFSYPGAYRVVNRGYACKDTIFIRKCAQLLAEFEPDVFIVYAGHNDFANWLERPTERIWLAEHAWLYELEDWLNHSRAYSLASGAVRFYRGSRRQAWGAPSPEVKARAVKAVLDEFTRNLEAVIELAARTGAEVILVTVVSNLHEHPVRRDDWDSGPDEQVRRAPARAAWARHYSRGVELFRGSHFDDALDEFKRARDEYPHGRAHSALNQRVRELAARFPHVHLVDFEAELDRLGVEQGIGCNFFGDEGWCDQFHPNARTHQLIGEALLDEMRRLREARQGPS